MNPFAFSFQTFASNVTILGDVLQCNMVDGIDLLYMWWLHVQTRYCLTYDLLYYDFYLSRMCYPAFSLSFAARGMYIVLYVGYGMVHHGKIGL